jgi:hypothetical protein
MLGVKARKTTLALFDPDMKVLWRAP